MAGDRDGGADGAAQGQCLGDHRLGGPAVGRRRIDGQPGGRHRRPGLADHRRPAGRRRPPLRPQQGGVFLRRAGRDHDLRRRGLDHLPGHRSPAQPPAAGIARHRPRRFDHGRRPQRHRRADPDQGRHAPPLHHPARRRQAPDGRRVHLGRGRGGPGVGVADRLELAGSGDRDPGGREHPGLSATG